MRGRGKARGRPAKSRRRRISKPRSVRTPPPQPSPVADLQEQLDSYARELREAREAQVATSEVLKLIGGSAFELEPVLQGLLEHAVRLCGANRGFIFGQDGDVYRVAASCGTSEEFLEVAKQNPIARDRRSATGRAIVERRVIHIHDILADRDYEWAEDHRDDNEMHRTILAVPMLRGDAIIGVITIRRTQVQPFTDAQISLLSTFADQAAVAIENTRLLNELRDRTDDLSEALEQQTATSEVLGIISKSPGELAPVFNAMLENATQMCHAKYGVMFLRENDDTVRAGAWFGVPPALAEERKRNPIIRPSPKTGVGRVLRSKETAHIADVLAEPEYIDVPAGFTKPGIVQFGGARTELAVPMLKDDELIGTIVIYRTEVQPFTDKQIELVQSFAAQAVIAIENTRLLNELRESLQQQTATANVLEVISRSAFDLQPVFETVAESAVRLCGADRAAVFRFDGEVLRCVVCHNAPPELESFIRGSPIYLNRSSGAGRAALERQTIHIPDVTVDSDYTHRSKDIAPVRTVLSVPILKGDDLLGVILTYRLEVRPFADKQIALVEAFADQAAIAIENVRLFDAEQRRTAELSDALQQQTATAEVLKVISRSTFDLHTVLQTLVEAAAKLCEADQGTIAREQKGVFVRAATYGFSAEFNELVKDVPVKRERGSATGRALVEGRTVHIPDVQADSDYTFSEAKELGGFRTILAVPMLREGAAIGVLALTRIDVRPFTDKQIELVSMFADQAAIAIENVRLFENVQARTRELAKSLEDLRTAQDRLVQTEKLASLGQLTAGIAHEIKNPLNFVNNFSSVSAELIGELQEALQRVHFDEKTGSEVNEITDMLRGNLEKVVQHGKRADSIVKNMLLHSRQGSGEHRPIDINSVVEESLNLAYHGARAEKRGFNITLQRSFDPAAGEVDLFPQEITRVLLNVISNGFYAAAKRKAGKNGRNYEPVLAASTKNLGDSVEITIRDNGVGILPEVKEKMFNPFFTTKPAGEGTGLGLSISHDIIVKQHCGSIEVDTAPGEYTEFRIVLPRKAATLEK